MMQTARFAVWTACVLVVLGLTACGGDDAEVPGRSIEQVARMAFDALKAGDLAPLHPALADDDDQAWVQAKNEAAVGADVLQAMREKNPEMFAPGALRTSIEERFALLQETERDRVAWAEAVYRGIDEERTKRHDDVEGEWEGQPYTLPIEFVEIAFLVEAAGLTHVCEVGAFAHPGRGWVVTSAPNHGGVHGWSGPSTATIRLSIDFERARAEGWIEEGADDQIAAATVANLKSRLKDYGVSEPDVRLMDPTTVAVGVPASLDPETIVPLLTARGDLRFRIQVLPSERNWTDSAQAFDDFKKAEVDRWLAAKADGKVYVPSESRYFVAPRFGPEAGRSEDFLVLEEPTEAMHRFDAGILKNPKVERDPNAHRAGVLYDIKIMYQDDFRAWTEANVGLSMAVLLDGVVHMAQRIYSPLSDSLQITLGAGSYWDLKLKAEDLVAILSAGGLRVPLRVRDITASGSDR